MSKLFKVLANASSIFKYANVFAQIANGLAVAATALKVTVEEIKKTNPDFKFLKTLESVLDFVVTIKDAVDGFIGIFGIKAPTAEVEEKGSKDGTYTAELDAITDDVKKLLK